MITNNWQRTAQKRKRRETNMGRHFIMGLYFGTRQVQTPKLEDCSSKLGCALNWLLEGYSRGSRSLTASLIPAETQFCTLPKTPGKEL